MSRTYRCRRLPVLQGTPHKLVDSRLYGRQGWKDHRKLAAGWGDTTYAVGFLLSHPWVRMAAGYSKRSLRIRGNRWVRRRARIKVRAWAAEGDDFEDRLPTKLDGWDYWELY